MSKYVLIALPLVLLSVLPVFAQTPGGPPPINRTNAERVRQQDMSRREYDLRTFGTEPGVPKDRRQVEALMAQTEEDFNRIMTLHNEIARALASKKRAQLSVRCGRNCRDQKASEPRAIIVGVEFA